MPDFRVKGPAAVPLVLQQERAECGLACVAMIAAAHGCETRLSELRGLAGGAARGSTLRDLVTVADRLQLIARPLRLDMRDLPKLRRPAILHWNLDHFVVLVRARGGRYVIRDPAVGTRSLDAAEVDRCFSGIALELQPATAFRQRRAGRLSPFAIARSFRRLGRFLCLMLVLLLVIQFLSLVPALATQLLIDEVVLGRDRAWLYGVLGGVFALMLITSLLDALRKWIALYAGTRFAADSTSSVLRHLFGLSPQFAGNRLVADIMSRVESLSPLREGVSEHSLNAVVQGSVLIATFALMCVYDWTLALLTVAGFLLNLLLVLVFLPRQRNLATSQLLYTARQNNSLMESLRSAAAVYCLGLSQARFGHWQAAFHEALQLRVTSGRLRIVQETAGSVLLAVEQVLFLGLAITAILGQRMTLGMLVAFFALRARFGAAAVSLLSTSQLLFMLRVHAERLEDIVFADAVPPPPQGAVSQDLKGGIRATGLAFAYDNRHALVRNFSCELRPSENVVITGPSGCGKTTLLKLLSAQLSADDGIIEYDDCDIASWDVHALRRQFGVVSQDDALFQGTIAENVCGFETSPDLARIQRVLTMTELWHDIRSMPMRLQTALSDMGGNLSGGQRQRLLLARALYRRPRILFLDEATSHLDVGTEQRILQRLRSLEITILSVAHRPEVLHRADRVIQIN